MTLVRLRPSRAVGAGARPGWIGTAGRLLALLLVFTVLPVAAGEGWSGHDCPHHGGHGGGEGHGPGSAGHDPPERHHAGHHAEPGVPTGNSGLSGGGHEHDHQHGPDGGPCTCVGLCTLGAAAFAGAPDPILRVQAGSPPERVHEVRYRGRTPSAPLLYALPRANAPPRA